MIRTLHLSAIALLTGTLLLSACQDKPAPQVETPPPTILGEQLRFPEGHPQLAQLGIVAAAPGKTIKVDLPARLVWNEDRTQRVYPAFAGRVTAISADVGKVVRPGTPLAQIASPDFGQAQADTARAQVDVRVTQKALARQRELFEAGIVPRKELEQAEGDAERAQAEGQRAMARTRLYGSATAVNQQLALTASVSGVVVERNLNPGQELRPDQSGPGVPALFVVSDPTSLWVQIEARESEIGTLHPGATFVLSVPAFPGVKFEGRIVSAADFIDPNTRTIKVRGMVDNTDRRLKAEMLATATIERSLGNGVVIPASAMILRGASHIVFVQVKPGIFEPREIVPGYSGSKEVVVARGLEAGEQVVSDNALLLARQFRTAQDDAATVRDSQKNDRNASAQPAKAASQ